MTNIILIKHKFFPLYFGVEVLKNSTKEETENYYCNYTCPINIYNSAVFVIDLTAKGKDYLDPHECFKSVGFYSNKKDVGSIQTELEDLLFESGLENTEEIERVLENYISSKNKTPNL